MSPTLRSLALALIFGALLVPASAQASSSQMSILMDDDLLVYRDDSTAAKALAQIKSLGVDTIRVTVLWKVVAEFARFTKADIAKLRGERNTRARNAARRQNRRFRPANPATYPTRNWDRFDNLVRAASARGIRVYFNVTGPGPAWAHAKPPKRLNSLRATWKPKAREFKLFVTAVGRRFSGTYRDENGDRALLPRVSMWSLWNEPNQGGWLSPQWEQRGSSRVPASPALFRKLHFNGYQGLVASGHRIDNDTILFAETAPLGSDARTEKAPMRPKLFLRELMCIQPNGTPYTGSAATARSCGDLNRGPLLSNGYAHHPYTKNVSPLQRDANPDSLTMANIGELGTLLDELSAKTGGKLPAGLPLYMTEFGFETNPPDPFSGIDINLQARYNTLGEFLAWANPRIAAQSQFLLADVAPLRRHRRGSKAYWFTYQSGLLFQRFQPKPASFAYAAPFRVAPAGTDPATGLPVVSVWGQLRALPNGAAEVAHVQWRAKDGSTPWVTMGDPVPIDQMGYFTATRAGLQPVAAEWRVAWLRPDGSVGLSSPGHDGT